MNIDNIRVAFCLVDISTTRIFYENFYHWPELLDEFSFLEDCLNTNIYSSILKNSPDDELDSLYYWVKEIHQQKRVEDSFKKYLEKRAPIIIAKGKNNSYRLSFSVYITSINKISQFLVLQIIPIKDEVDQSNLDNTHNLIEEFYRGIKFGEAFFNYSIMDSALLLDQAKTYLLSDVDFKKNYEKLKSLLKEIEEIAIWLQLHTLTEMCQDLHKTLEQSGPKLKNNLLEQVNNKIKIMDDILDLGIAIAQYSITYKDIGKLRHRRTSGGLDEQKFRKLVSDFEILKRLFETFIDPPEVLKAQMDKCYHQIMGLDHEVLNEMFSRLNYIAMDLSNDLDKIIQFDLDAPKIMTANHYSQHLISKFLINTLKYIIIEHLEILPKERRLAGKPIVCKVSLSVVDKDDLVTFVFKDDGILFDFGSIIDRAVKVALIPVEVGKWMLEHDKDNIYNLMLKPGFGPAVKPPPLTRYRPYLSMIEQEAQALQGKMSFIRDTDNRNVIKLEISKSVNGLSFGPPIINLANSSLS